MTNYEKIPEFGQLVEYITQGPLIGDTYGIVINSVPLENCTIDSNSLNSIKIDYEKINTISPTRIPNISDEGLTLLKTSVGIVLNTDIVKYTTSSGSNALQIVTKLINVVGRPNWVIGINVSIGNVYFYTPDKNLYQCIQAHKTQIDWTPPVCKALWKKFYEPSDNILAWIQPIGSVDAYPINAKVTYGGYTWINTIKDNVWKPGVTGWTNLTPPVDNGVWTYPKAYKIGDIVTYTGVTYKCLQAHNSQAGWTPPVVPALWQKV